MEFVGAKMAFSFTATPRLFSAAGSGASNCHKKSLVFLEVLIFAGIKKRIFIFLAFAHPITVIHPKNESLSFKPKPPALKCSLTKRRRRT